jgi:glyoxylase-like metal-dependent hydrolase (beta-lactamase superfamily II)
MTVRTQWKRATLSRVLLVLTAMAPAVPVVCAPAPTPYDTINAAAASATIDSSPLRRGLIVLFGSGGNITVLTGANGKFLVDGGIALSKVKLKAALDAIGPEPLKYLVNTHWHWDHSDGNEWLHNLGATIIARPETLKDLQSTIRIEEWGHTFTPVPPAALPTVLISKEKIMDFDRERVVIRPYLPSHTNGDLVVYFTRADVLATGDTYWNGLYPFIDHEVGGGIDGMIRAANMDISAAGDNTIIVPGHGPLSGKKDLMEYRDMLVDIRNKVSSLKSEGLSEEQAIAAKPSAAYDGKWGTSIINPALFVHLIYVSLPASR